MLAAPGSFAIATIRNCQSANNNPKGRVASRGDQFTFDHQYLPLGDTSTSRSIEIRPSSGGAGISVTRGSIETLFGFRPMATGIHLVDRGEMVRRAYCERGGEILGERMASVLFRDHEHRTDHRGLDVLHENREEAGP
jgi:hypothetical protein